MIKIIPNLFRLQTLAPLVLVSFIYTHFSWHTILLVSGISIAISQFLGSFSKLLLFAIIGMIRGHYFETPIEHYTYKRTSFSAQIVDLKIKEHGICVELENFQYVPLNTKEYTQEDNRFENEEEAKQYKIDPMPQFPKIAQMRIAKIENEDAATCEQHASGKDKFCESVRKPTRKRKPQNFDFKAFYKIMPQLVPGSKIHAVGRFLLPTPGPIAETTHMKLPSGLIDEFYVESSYIPTFKTHLRSAYDKNLSKPSAQMAKAILLGDTFAIDQSLREKFQEAGIAHLLGVSVLNIAILGLMFYFVIRRLIGMLFHKIALHVPLDIVGKIGALMITGTYCYLVGFEYPLLRSLLMSSFAIIALYFGRNRNKEALMWAASCILLINPLAIYNIGFELSFGAVLGLCCAPNLRYKIGQQIIGQQIVQSIWVTRVFEKLRQLINVLIKSIYSTFFASSIILPISLYQFHTTAMQPFLANIIAIPFVTLIITPISFAANMFSFCNIAWLQKLSMYLLDYCFTIFSKIASFFAPLGLCMHVDPIASYGCLIFTLTLVIFACLDGILRYITLIIGISTLTGSIMFRAKAPLLLVHPYAIGLILEDKIVAYPKCNFITNIWEQAYNLKCVCGKNLSISDNDSTLYFQKEKCGKIVVLGKFGLIFQEPKGTCIIPTKNYIVPYSQQMRKTTMISLSKKN